MLSKLFSKTETVVGINPAQLLATRDNFKVSHDSEQVTEQIIGAYRRLAGGHKINLNKLSPLSRQKGAEREASGGSCPTSFEFPKG